MGSFHKERIYGAGLDERAIARSQDEERVGVVGENRVFGWALRQLEGGAVRLFPMMVESDRPEGAGGFSGEVSEEGLEGVGGAVQRWLA